MSSNHLDRKALKKPDQFTQTLGAAFRKLAGNAKAVAALAIALLLAAGVIAMMQHQKSKNAHEARGALYRAQQTLQKELEAMAPKVEAPKAPAQAAQEPKDAEPEMVPDLAAVEFQKFSVDEKLANGVAALKHVAENYGGTRSAFDAMMMIGNLYYRHGTPDRSIEWFEMAIDEAPNAIEKSMAQYSLGYAKEAAGKSEEALRAYEQALTIASKEVEPLKGDLLLAMARTHQSLGNKEKAIETYQRVVSELPGTPFAETAEALRGSLN